MITLLSDPAVSAVPVRECGEPLVELVDVPTVGVVRVRQGLADRLVAAADLLPPGILLKVVEGHRSPSDQARIIRRYRAELCAAQPQLTADEVVRLSSRFVAPLAVAPHVAGAAVDLTLVDLCGDDLDLGTRIDETPEQSGGRCYFAAADVSADARAHRDLLAGVLEAVGLVNYPTEWWHWSYGDRYWALATGVDAALYGPVDVPAEVVA